MPFVPKDECFSKIDDHWSPYYTHDKICAGEEKGKIHFYHYFLIPIFSL